MSYHGPTHADALVLGAGLAGLVAASELVDAGKTVIVVDQEPEASLGGQAFWSFGGLFLVDSPEQRRLGIKDSYELARTDWFGTAGFDRAEDYWPRQWAEAYLDFAAGEKRSWLREKGIGLFPIVGWAERGGDRASAHGNSVPRFHITWGTGPGVLEPFIARCRQAEADGLLHFAFRHQVDELTVTNGTVTGVTGSVLAPDSCERGESSTREVIGEFSFSADAVLMSTGGIGANLDLVRKNWPAWLGKAPQNMISGVPAHVDGRGQQIAGEAGAHLINTDRMWHYTEGIRNHSPIWPNHGIRILPGPSALWLDAYGTRLPTPFFPGFDTLGTLQHILSTGQDHSWFIMNQAIIEKEVALSGSEQNPDLTGKDIRLLAQRLGSGAPGPVEKFKTDGPDFIVANSVGELFTKLGEASDLLDLNQVKHELLARDQAMVNPFGKDAQVTAIRQARNFLGDKLMRVATPGPILDPQSAPLIAIKLHILTRKTLGGIETNLTGQALDASGTPIPGLFAAGEVSGFGGGGVHGYRALEGTFLGGCLFSGRTAGRAMARTV